jgi:hypothetical protein
MTKAAAVPCTYNTRLAGLMSGLLAVATFYYLRAAYDRLPLLVPISFEGGNPLSFAFKSRELVYLPFGFQLALGAIFAAVVAVLLSRRDGADPEGVARTAAAAHTAEGVALLAVVWIGFQAVNAWRLTELWRHMFDPNVELYVLAVITAMTATVIIAARAVLQVQETGGGLALLRTPVLAGRRPYATAGLAALLALGLGTPLVMLSLVWDVLKQI